MAGLQNIDYEVEKILDKRITDLGITEYLVHWKEFNSDWDTWEPVHNLGNCRKIIRKFEKSINVSDEPVKHLRKVLYAKSLNDEIIDTSGRQFHKNATLKGKNKNSSCNNVKAMIHAKRSKARNRIPIKVSKHVGKRQQKGKLYVNLKKKSKKVGKSGLQKLKRKPELIEVDDEITLSVVKDNSSKEAGTFMGKSESLLPTSMSGVSPARSKVKNSSQKFHDSQVMEDIFKAVLKPTSASGQTVTRKTRSTNAKDVGKQKVVRTPDRRVSSDKSTGTDDMMASRGSRLSVSKRGESTKTIKSTQLKRHVSDTTINNPGKKKRSPQTDKGNVHLQPSSQKKDTSKIDELYNHLLEQVRAATPPHKPSKHKAIGVKNELKSGKAKAHSPKSREIKGSGLETKQPKVVFVHINKNENKKVGLNVKSIDTSRKTEKTAVTKKEKSRAKPTVGQKRKAAEPVTIETDNESNSDDGVLYSLSDLDESDSTPSPSQSPQDISKSEKHRSLSRSAVGKEQKGAPRVKKVSKPVKSQTDSGADKCEKPKKIRLLDSLKKPGSVKPVRPVSPTPLFTTVKTAAVMPTTSRKNNFGGGIPMYQYVIQPSAAVPVSPTSMSYKMLLENLPHQLHPKKNKNKSQDEGEEDVERRMSVIQELQSALNAAKYDNSNLVMLSGLGNVFCSGIDLHFLLTGDRTVAARQMVDALRDFTKTLITFPKLIVAVVTGPAIGLGMTILPLCDVVYASDKATFFLPYAQLAQTPEGCASYTLPQALGMAMANELLIGGRKITAIEACQLGLVSQVYWPTSMMQEVIPRVQNMAQSSGKVLETTKLLIRSHQRTKLDLTNESESNLLLERWSSAECQKAITEFLNDERNYTF